jgi:hypothetical protein
MLPISPSEMVLEAGSRYVFRASGIDVGMSFSLSSISGASALGTLPLSGSGGATYTLTLPRDVVGASSLTFSSGTASSTLPIETTCSPLCRDAYLADGICDAVCNNFACRFDALPPRFDTSTNASNGGMVGGTSNCGDDPGYSEGGFSCAHWASTNCSHAASAGINVPRLHWSCPSTCGTCNMSAPLSDCANTPSVTYLVSGGDAATQYVYTFALADHVPLARLLLESGKSYIFIANGVNPSLPFMLGPARGVYIEQSRVLDTTQGPLTGAAGRLAFNTAPASASPDGSYVIYATSAAATTSPPVQVPARIFTILYGESFCHTTADGLCVTDDPIGQGDFYGNNERCAIHMDAAATITATSFNTESRFDYLYVYRATYNRVPYHGTTGPVGVAMAPGESMYWRTDGSVVRSGAPHAPPNAARCLTASATATHC